MKKLILWLCTVMLLLNSLMAVSAWAENNPSDGMTMEAAQSEICAAIEERYGGSCQILNIRLVDGTVLTPYYRALVCMEGMETLTFEVSFFPEENEVLDTYPTVIFSAAYAHSIKQSVIKQFPQAEIHVSVSTAVGFMNGEYGAAATLHDVLSEEELLITIRLLLQGDQVNAEELAVLTEELAEKRYYGHYACCIVEDTAKAMTMIIESDEPERALFASGVMKQYTGFDIRRSEPEGVSVQSIEENIVGRDYEVAEGLTITPHDYYAMDIELKDAAEYEKYFDAERRLSPVYAFTSVGDGYLTIDLKALGLEKEDFGLYMLVYDEDERTMKPERLRGIRLEDSYVLNTIPNRPFCFMQKEE